MPIEYLTPAIEDRAFEVQCSWPTGQHRAVDPDLLIAGGRRSGRDGPCVTA